MTTAERDELTAALAAWRDSLLSLSGTNRLISFRPSKTGSVLIDSPSPDTVLSALERKKLWSFRGDVAIDSSRERTSAPPAPGTYLHSPRPDSEIGSVVRSLMRRATAEFLDRGLSVLYLAFGTLHWLDTDGAKMVSPLLLVPASLVPEGPRGTPRLGLGDDEYVINPALALRLQERNIALPAIEDLDGLSVSEVLVQVERSVKASRESVGWEIRSTTYLSIFSFAKEAMYRDLIDNEEQILDHPIVRALANTDPTKQTGEFNFEPIDPNDIDRLAPPELTPLVLDADSSQRSAIAAAVEGHSFVMDGPPGTGKSQTIANMIGALLHAGKTVLFVSEKVAALDVVRNRLNEAGLGSYLLELHSHKASRKEVATELLRALDNETVDPGAISSADLRSAKEKREALSEYVAAMNELRMPLAVSAHDVFGQLADLAAVPSAPAPDVPPRELSREEYHAVEECLARLERAWRPATQGSSFLWRGIEDRSSLDIRLYQAGEALFELKADLALIEDFLRAFQLNRISDVPRIVALITHRHSDRPSHVRDEWLSVGDLRPVLMARDLLISQIEAVEAARRAFRFNVGVEWNELPDPELLPPRPDPISTAHSPIALDHLSAATMAATAEQFEARAARLRDHRRAVDNVAKSLGLNSVKSLADADRVIAAGDLRKPGVVPERRWLTASGAAAAREALAVLGSCMARLAAAEGVATARFTSEALRVPLAELSDRFINLHRGLRKLSRSYRADRSVVAGLLKDASSIKEGIQHLTDAVSWRDATDAFAEAENHHARALGAHWQGRDTDLDAVTRSLQIAEAALDLCRNEVPLELADYLTSGRPDSGQGMILDAARTEFVDWRASVRPAPAVAGRPELLLESIDASVDWLTVHASSMKRAVERISAITVKGDPLTLTAIDDMLALRARVVDSLAEISMCDGSFSAWFGGLYEGADTRRSQLDAALDWAIRLREMNNGPLIDEQVAALESVPNLESLRMAYQKWTSSRDKVVNAFAAERREELLTEFDTFDDASSLITELRSDSIGQDEWFAFNGAREELSKHGLETSVDFCIDRRVQSNEVPPIVRRALLRAWVDDLLKSDRRLHPQLAYDRDALVREYRKLDRELIVRSTSSVIRSVNSRRPPRTSLGEPAVIRRQGMLKRRHMPVRDLIRQTRTTTLALKPCFMMSPLAVSQYLPPDMNFDVIIFDEASQVTPGDAINCIYRGKEMILAGDDKQLPPTSFFERVVDDEGNEETDVTDFQSILELAKGAGAFLNLGLRWHYRSRHEDLIAFSNYKFYDGKLVTYPSAHSEGDEVGVAFYPTNGVYRRGAGADNPIEAAEVAERVIEHYTTRPDLTLGVVTFSVAQADAVTAALDKIREERPDLERHFDRTDRLKSFFIRSLESVQGDERDVIIFSIGYGPDEAGKVSTGFGVLNKPKGWRRLNVGITRARQRVEVVASMRAGDIPPSTNENVEYLRAYLDYADRGPRTLAIAYESTGKDPESPFEESVLSTLRSWGHIVEPQVGAAGFRIDLGVRHPAHPGMFAIGVECDGYQYHSAPAARDRDRLRDQILRGLGWQLHRIWGTAWYRNRDQEENRLRTAVEEAIATPASGRVGPSAALERPAIRTMELDTDEQPSWTSEYTVASRVHLPRWVNPIDRANYLHLRDPIAYLVRVEGPVHIEVVYERVRGWWDVGRVSQKFRDTIDLAVKAAPINRDGSFLDFPGRGADRVRVPSNGVIRKAEHVHRSELALAAELLLRDIGAESRDELVRGVARVFGWGRVGASIEQAVSVALGDLLSQGRVVDDGGRFRLAGR